MKKLLLMFTLLFALIGNVFAAVDINTASESELDGLKGIGPVKAKAIAAYRKANGPFKSVDDLAKVKGIGKATVDGLRKDVTVAGGSAKTAKAAQPAEKKAADAKVADKKVPEAKAVEQKAPEAKPVAKDAKAKDADKKDEKKGTKKEEKKAAADAKADTKK
jgi:competence protein ComEA